VATFNKFQCFSQDLGRGVHNLNADTLKVLLTDVAPVATNTIKANLTEIAAGNGYTAGGATVAATAYSQSSGTAKLTGANAVIAAAGGAIAQFRYAVLYNSTASGGLLIGWWDCGGEINMSSTTSDQLQINWDGTNGSST